MAFLRVLLEDLDSPLFQEQLLGLGLTGPQACGVTALLKRCSKPLDQLVMESRMKSGEEKRLPFDLERRLQAAQVSVINGAAAEKSQSRASDGDAPAPPRSMEATPQPLATSQAACMKKRVLVTVSRGQAGGKGDCKLWFETEDASPGVDEQRVEDECKEVLRQLLHVDEEEVVSIDVKLKPPLSLKKAIAKLAERLIVAEGSPTFESFEYLVQCVTRAKE